MVLRRTYTDTVRDQETLSAVRKARGAMEALEYAFFKEGSIPWSDVATARDEYWEVWEERRNFVLSDKYGITEDAVDRAIAEFEGASPG